VGGPKPRLLLAILLLDANRVVSRDRLIEGLWGEAAPSGVAHSLDDYVSRVRKALGADRLSRKPPGYVLRVDAGELDLDRFEQLLAEGRDQLGNGDEVAGETLREALAVWRGSALADLAYERAVSEDVRRLEERRLVALEDRIDADLAAGQGPELTDELERLVQQHPLRERLVAQLMLALYRSGRQSQALEVFRATRRAFADELGIEPGPALQELEQRILGHDPQLAAQRRRNRSLPVRSGRRRWAAVVAVTVAVALAISLPLATEGSTQSRPIESRTNQIVGVDARSGDVLRTRTLAGAATAAMGSGESVWLANPDAGTVARFDLRSGRIVQEIPIAGGPGALAVGGGSIWVASVLGGSVSRIDPLTEQVTRAVKLGVNPSALAFGDGSLWVGDPSDQALIRIDPQTGTARQTVSLTTRPSALAVGNGAVWVASQDDSTVTEVDPRSGQMLATIPVGQGPVALIVAAGSVWVANQLDGTVSRIDPQTASVTATIPTGSSPNALTSIDGSLWVANGFSATVSRIDPRRNIVVKEVEVGGRATTLSAARNAVWATTEPAGQHRGGTLTLLANGPLPTVDPALEFEIFPLQLQALSHDALITFDHVSGSAGLNLVPDLALALPTRTDNGLTYIFRLRPGLRYSNGRTVQADDFRRAFQRLYRLNSPITGYFSHLVGAAACASDPTKCDLSSGIATSDTTRTVTFHLRSPDPEFLFKLAFLFTTPIPPGTPFHELRSSAIPGTGPYRIVRADAHEIKLVRNSYFREWSHAAQPVGNPDTIIWRFGLSPAAEVHAIEHGHGDWMADAVPGPLLANVQQHYAAELHTNPAPETDFLSLNTRLPPFNEVRARQALNLAIDRSYIARLYGGSDAATPTCQVLPPGVPGYRRYCPYTRDPNHAETWTAPNLIRARQLISASHTQGDHITVWGFSDDFTIRPTVVRYIVTVLSRLGYHTRLRLISHAGFHRLSAAVKRSVQVIPNGWYSDYPAASDFFGIFLSCHSAYNNSGFCDPTLDRMMNHADHLSLTNPKAATNLWARIDRRAVNEAAWAPLVNPRTFDFVSTRAKNYQHNALWGILADQLWVR